MAGGAEPAATAEPASGAEPAASAEPAATAESAIAQLTTSLVRAVRRLGDLGEPATAAQIAAEAYVALRRDQPRAAERLNGVMHYLARLEAAGQDKTGGTTP